MANELAAMEHTPSGATMVVIAICALHITPCSKPIGKPILTAFLSVSAIDCLHPRSPASRRCDVPWRRYHNSQATTTVSASTVPRAAPSTPSPAPGRNTSNPATATVREGKISRTLNTTSRAHIATPAMLGTCILPLHRSMPPARNCI